MPEQFYVKIRGRVLGPFPPDRLSQMAKQGQLSRIHMISDDGNSWQKAAEYPQFFQSSIQTGPAPGVQNTPVAEQPQPQPDTTHVSAGNEAPAQEEWHYAVNEQSFGPVNKGTLLNLISSSKLSRSDMIWKSGMDDWQPVSAIPELAFHSEQAGNHAFQTTSSGQNNSDSTQDLTECALTVRSTFGWVIFVCIFLYLTTASLFLFFIYGIVQAAKLESSILVGQAIIVLLQCGVMGTAALFLNRYASAANKFALTKDMPSLNLSLRWLGRFWLFLSIVLIVWLVFFVILLIEFVSIGAEVF